MQLFLLIFSSLLIASASAESSLPWVFFAKFDGKYIPLSSSYLKDFSGGFNVFSYSKEWPDPVELTIKNMHAYAKQGGYSFSVGFSNGGFGFSPELSAATLDLDDEGKVLYYQFHSCNLYYRKGQVIMYDIPRNISDFCLPVEVYLRQYNETTKSAVGAGPYGKTFVIFVKVNETYIPLSGRPLREEERWEKDDRNSNIFYYGDRSKPPVDITINGTHAYVDDESGPWYVGYTKEKNFRFGPQIVPMKLDLGYKNRLQQTYLRSCKIPGSEVHEIGGPGETRTCPFVLAYLSRYNRRTGSYLFEPLV